MGITDTGLAELAGLAGDSGSPTAFTYLAVGDDNTAFVSTQTALGNEITGNGLGRAVATISLETTNVSEDTLRLNYTWTVSGTETIKEAGIFNDSSAGIMLARKVLTSARSVASGDSFQYTYDIIFA